MNWKEAILAPIFLAVLAAGLYMWRDVEILKEKLVDLDSTDGLSNIIATNTQFQKAVAEQAVQSETFLEQIEENVVSDFSQNQDFLRSIQGVPFESRCRIIMGSGTTKGGWLNSSKAVCNTAEIAVGGGCSAANLDAGPVGRLLGGSTLDGYECALNKPNNTSTVAQAVCCR